MAITKDEQEEISTEKFLSTPEALKLLKETPNEERVEIMQYGINKVQSKTLREFAKEFLKLENLYPQALESRDISKIMKNIDIEEELVWFMYYCYY